MGVRFPYASTRTLSRSPVLARPVRTLANSRLKRSSAACIRVSRSFTTCCMALPPGWYGVVRHDRAYRLAGHDAPDIPPCREVEHHDGQLVVHAERDGRGVHHLEATVEGLDVADAGQLDGLGILQGVGRVDAVHTRGLEERLRADLHGTQSARGVRGEERVAG